MRHSGPGCSFVWILRVVYFPVKHSCLYNKNELCHNHLPYVAISHKTIPKDHLQTKNKYLTIIPWARVGYKMVNSQRGAKRRVGYNQSHIQQARME